MPRNPGAPSVFISSTSDDLKEFRKAADRAASRGGFHQVMMEDFPAAGHAPLDVCRAKVSEADVLVAIVAHRYGCVPADQPANPFARRSARTSANAAWSEQMGRRWNHLEAARSLVP
jgi:hypothetical protein